MIRLNPITRKRLRRFRQIKRAWWSFWILLAIYCLSMVSELLCNSQPLYVRHDGDSYFPFLPWTRYSEDQFTGSGVLAKPEWKKLRQHPVFKENDDNFMVFTLVPYDPYESAIDNEESLPVANEVRVRLTPRARQANVNVREDLTIARSAGLAPFYGLEPEEELKLRGRDLTEQWPLTEALREGITKRLANEPAPPVEARITGRDGQAAIVSMREYEPRSRAGRSVRLRLEEPPPDASQVITVTFGPAHQPLEPSSFWDGLDAAEQEQIRELVRARFKNVVEARTMTLAGQSWFVEFYKEDIRFPFRPIGDHYMGLDSAGRDVLARILYATRIALNFGILLVTFAMALGMIVGAVQGYFGGWVDFGTQRFIEIWGAIPFLYVMILVGGVIARSFWMLLALYMLFNWIGISFYVRAEFFRLRGEAFVEAARCLGLPTWKIIFKHILPNALVPVITFFPFSLVGAIGILSSLDYLGFGLPPGTPSWGQLLLQAQRYRHAWWLIVYPFMALFTIMLLGVFIGEGVRSAYNPKKFSRMV